MNQIKFDALIQLVETMHTLDILQDHRMPLSKEEKEQIREIQKPLEQYLLSQGCLHDEGDGTLTCAGNTDCEDLNNWLDNENPWL